MEQTWNQHVALAGRALVVYWHLSSVTQEGKLAVHSGLLLLALFIAEEGCSAPLNVESVPGECR